MSNPQPEMPLDRHAQHPLQSLQRTTATLGSTTAQLGLSSTVQVTLSIDALTESEVRMVLARAALTHPDVVAEASSHVLNILRGEQNAASIAPAVPVRNGVVPSIASLATAYGVHHVQPPLPSVATGAFLPIATTTTASETRTAAELPSPERPPQKKVRLSTSAKDGEEWDDGWDEKFKELKDFKEKFNHANVDAKIVKKHPEYKELMSWSDNQRKFRRRYLQGKDNPRINPHRIAKLQMFGFQW